MNTMKFSQPDELTLTSIKGDWKRLTWDSLRADLIAGITVALVTVPQAMAHALVADLPLKCGLISAIFASLIAAIFGSCRHIVIGPNTALSILVQYSTSQILYNHFRHIQGPERDMLAVQILTMICFFIALFQVGAAVFRLGRLTQFVSHSVILGYLAGTAFAVFINQLFTFFGVVKPEGVSSLFDKGIYLLTHASYVHWPTTLIGLSGVALLLLFKRVHSKMPSAALTMLATSLFVYLLGISSDSEVTFWGVDLQDIGAVLTVQDAGEIGGIIPTLQLPFFDRTILSSLLPSAFAIALLSILETSSVAKSTVSVTGEKLNINQEILGVSFSNMLASLMGGLPNAASPIRSAVLLQSGAQTRFGAIFNAVGTWILIAVFGMLILKAPLAALSAILLLSATSLVDFKQLLICLKSTNADAFVFFATFISCFFFTLDVAFFVGIALSVTFYLNKAAVPHLVECVYDQTGKISTGNQDDPNVKLIRVINIQGELFFGAADLFQAALKSIAEDHRNTEVIILRMKNARDMDATACLAIQRLYEYLRSSNRYLLACGITNSGWQVLCDSGLVELIRKENLFLYDYRNPKLSLQKALSRAKILIARSQEKEATTEKLDHLELTEELLEEPG